MSRYNNNYTRVAAVFSLMTRILNTNQHVLTCASIGLFASQALSTDQDAQIIGSTSKGVFIKTSGKWLVFLAFEQFKGPLTITLEKFDPLLQRIPGGSNVRIASNSIFIPDPAVTINLEGTPVWQPPPPAAPLLDRSEWNENMRLVAKEILAKKEAGGIGSLIPAYLGVTTSQPRLPGIKGFDGSQLERIKNYVSSEEVSGLVELLSSVLGLGPGLTPSADDFTLGLLLTLNRWRIPSWKTSNLHVLNSQMVEAAYKKTTTLSANFIECASQGLANERLINALDWLVTGVRREPDVITPMLNWGHSSGMDAFSGMVVALSA